MQKYPKAIGPYSIFRIKNGFLYASGQLPIDSEKGELVSESIPKETEQSLKNVKAILEENGFSLDDVVKTTVFLSDIAHFAPMNEVYSKFFSPPYPARSVIGVKNLPLGANVEIEVIASKG
ncbi:MAG: Rid family detoxifying hydrolase [Campylobacteraceae bacterium]